MNTSVWEGSWNAGIKEGIFYCCGRTARNLNFLDMFPIYN